MFTVLGTKSNLVFLTIYSSTAARKLVQTNFLIYSSSFHLHFKIFNKVELSDHGFSLVEAYTKVQKAQGKCCGHVWASSYQKGHLRRQKEKEYFNNLGFFKALHRYEYIENGKTKV